MMIHVRSLWRIFAGLSLLWIFVACVCFATQSCEKKVPIPAQQIVGIWNGMPVNFYIDSDSCGDYVKLKSKSVTMAWNITYVDENLVNVLILPQDIGITTQLDSTCESAVKDSLGFPINLRGIVSSTTLVLENTYTYLDTSKVSRTAFTKVGTFKFNSATTLRGALGQKFCDSTRCRGYQTDTTVMSHR